MRIADISDQRKLRKLKDLVDLIGSTEEAIGVIWIEVAYPGSLEVARTQQTQRAPKYVTSGITLMEKGKSRDNQSVKPNQAQKPFVVSIRWFMSDFVVCPYAVLQQGCTVAGLWHRSNGCRRGCQGGRWVLPVTNPLEFWDRNNTYP